MLCLFTWPAYSKLRVDSEHDGEERNDDLDVCEQALREVVPVVDHSVETHLGVYGVRIREQEVGNGENEEEKGISHTDRESPGGCSFVFTNPPLR